MKMKKNTKIMMITGNYHQKDMMTMRKRKRKRKMTTTLKLLMTTHGAHYLIAHIMILMICTIASKQHL